MKDARPIYPTNGEGHPHSDLGSRGLVNDPNDSGMAVEKTRFVMYKSF